MKNCLCFFLLFFFCSAMIFAQQTKVNGVVISGEDNEPVIGASVTVKGKPTIGTVTDLDGKFVLNVPTGTKTLVVSYIGMKAQEVAAKANQKVVLESDAQQIEEVVVTGYQKVDRRLFTGAAEKIKGDDAKIAGVTDISQGLQGKAAGVQVQSVSGTFGAAPKIRVRGASSIYGNQNPLWVVDGVVLEDVVEVSADDLSSGNASTLISSAVAGLNADDIESFQILKDASATALYGARAMNGVIVVTTKRGKKGSASISYTGEFTMRARPSYSQYNIMNSKDQMSVYMDMKEKGSLLHTPTATAQNGGVFFQMYDNMYPKGMGESWTMENTPTAMARFLQQAEMRNTNWFKELFRPTLQNNHSISITSGTDRSRFYTSMSFYNDPGWTKADNVTRYTANMNAAFDLTKNFTITLNTSGSLRKQRAPGTTDRSVDVVNGEYTRDFDINPFSYALNTSRTMAAKDANGNPEFYRMNYAPFSIINELENNYMNIDMTDLKFQLELNYKPVKGLELSALGAVRYVKSSQEQCVTEYSNMAQAYRAGEDDATIRDKNKFLYKDFSNPDAMAQVVMPKGGFYNVTNNNLLSYYFRATANYNTLLGGQHPFNVMIGEEVKSADRSNGFNNGYGYQWDKGGTPFIDYRIIQQILQANYNYYGLSQSYDRFVAFFGTASGSYKGKYTLNVTGRVDGSNRLGRARSVRWLPTWNVSGAWNVMEESFMQDQKAISALSLRATYGLVASMGPASNALPIYQNQTTFRNGQKESQIVIADLQNSDLTWEKQYEFNFGFDLGVINNRLSVSADVYSRRGFDLIGYIRTSGVGGQYTQAGNYANMKSHGVEFSLNSKNIVTKDFNWSTNMTFAYNKNEVTNLKSKPRIIDLVLAEGGPMEGYPVRGLFSYQFKGLDNNGFPTFLNEKGEITVTDLNFQEANDLSCLKYEGSVDPKFTGGLENSFNYKNWRFSFYLTYQFGSKVRLNPDFTSNYDDTRAMPKEMKNRWMMPGDEIYTNVPVIPNTYQLQNIADLQTAYNAYNYSDVRVAKGDFIRLKEISLSYDFKGNWMKTIGMNNLQVRLVASNLWLIYADKKLNGQDPEFFRAGGVALPTPRQFTLTLKTSF